jgi:hypothetical protein
MQDFDAVSRTAQVLTHFFGHHDRAVLPAGAAKSDRQITFAFMNVMGQQVNQQIRDTRNEFLGLRE